MSKYKLAFGPMSKEIIETIFMVSAREQTPLMLIASRNQVDHNFGYVMKTAEYAMLIGDMKRKYPNSDVLVCRDHCGPGFGNPDEPKNQIDTTMDTIEKDIKFGFDLLHIDLCKYDATFADKIASTLYLLEFAFDLNEFIEFEIGTDENDGVLDTDPKRYEEILDMIGTWNPMFYVVQTGSLVKENRNTGRFEGQAMWDVFETIRKRGIKVKEHNADYLSANEILRRNGAVDAMNVAPQLGLIQTQTTMSLANIYGIDTTAFVNKVFSGGKWQKWVHRPCNFRDKGLAVLVAGHYHFNDDEYMEVLYRLNKEIDIRRQIIRNVSDTIMHYVRNFGGSRWKSLKSHGVEKKS